MIRKQFTDQQLTEFVERRSPEHPRGMIDRDTVQALLDGRLVLREETATAGCFFETGNLVEKLIKAGYHKVTNGGQGMSASTYRKLWPKNVVQPPEYAGRFDEILLVDRTIAIPELVKCGNFNTWTNPAECVDLASAPESARYIAFVQLGKKNLKRTVEDCSKTFAADEVGLVTVEGLHLPVQYQDYLHNYAVDLAGSRCLSVSAPYVNWFGDVQPFFNASCVRSGGPCGGSASRGSAVIAVPRNF